MSSAATIALSTACVLGPIHAFGNGLDAQSNAHAAPEVFIIGGDIYLRQSLELLIRAQGWQPQICDTTQEFLARSRARVPSALILAFPSQHSNLLIAQTINKGDWSAAEQNPNRGISLDPNDSIAEFKYAIYREAVGRAQDAVAHMRRAVPARRGSLP